ncbi:MAG: hypothetical protein JWM02_3655 [Frankiales bacterium]|nr:hypothetical protein [Frankiales bacterium]
MTYVTIRALLLRLDTWLARSTDQRIPTLAVCPPAAVHDTTRPAAGVWDHCDCCTRWLPAPCPLTHTTPCDKDACGQTWAVQS